MATNKVIYAGVVLIDLTADTVTPDKLLEGITAHNAKGELITGTLKLGPTYTNQVPISTDTDGSIYNKVGYKDDARLSSSGGVSSSAQAGSVVTGFIPWQSRGIIRIKGGTFPKNDTGHYYINFYNADKTYYYGGDDNSFAQTSGAFSKMVHTYDEATGVSTLDFSGMNTGTAIGDAAINASYFRINLKGKGADLIITVNEPIA